jgi:type I restriction enzyme, S subunit
MMEVLVLNSEFIPAIDFCEAVIDGTHDSPKQVEDGRKLVTSKNIVGGKLDLENCYNISEEDFEQINRRSRVYEWDILISMIGTVGEVCLLKEEPDYAIKNVGVFRARNESDAKWLYYYLTSPNAQFEIYSRLRGSTQKFLPLGELRNFPIRKPENEEIKSKIINQLFQIDCLIDNNRKLNQKISKMASALFRSWFIDFDPVKAKSEGKSPYGMDEETAALFPDSFEDSELGRIPTGWEVGKLSDIAKITMGTSPPGETYCELDSGILPLLNGAGDFNDSIIAPKQGTTQPTKIANDGDFVFCIRATIGNLSVCEEKYCIGRGVSSAREKNWFDRGFLHQIISNLFRVWEWEATGSVIKGITGSEVKNAPVVLPPESIRKSFENTVMGSMLMIQKCMNLEKSLSTFREALLPRLMSGELEI